MLLPRNSNSYVPQKCHTNYFIQKNTARGYSFNAEEQGEPNSTVVRGETEVFSLLSTLRNEFVLKKRVFDRYYYMQQCTMIQNLNGRSQKNRILLNEICDNSSYIIYQKFQNQINIFTTENVNFILNYESFRAMISVKIMNLESLN